MTPLYALRVQGSFRNTGPGDRLLTRVPASSPTNGDLVSSSNSPLRTRVSRRLAEVVLLGEVDPPGEVVHERGERIVRRGIGTVIGIR